MDDGLYLILHKVRGEPAFDVAQYDAEMGKITGNPWMIPTSGHAAYPAQSWPLADMPFTSITDIPDDLRDHYAVSRGEDDNAYVEDMARQALMRRGILKSKPKNTYRRR